MARAFNVWRDFVTARFARVKGSQEIVTFVRYKGVARYECIVIGQDSQERVVCCHDLEPLEPPEGQQGADS